MNKVDLYKVVLVFNLTPGMADEELRRSANEYSFPNMLAKQPGFIEYDLVKISDDKTMSIQTWETEKHWWAALETVKNLQQQATGNAPHENILVSREFLNGYIKSHRAA